VGKKSRDKGARGEREVRDVFNRYGYRANAAASIKEDLERLMLNYPMCCERFISNRSDPKVFAYTLPLIRPGVTLEVRFRLLSTDETEKSG
jgi:hypothetical protein